MSDDDESASECDSDIEKLEYTAAAMQRDDPFFNKVCAIVCVCVFAVSSFDVRWNCRVRS